jgi:glutamate-1-semialdehyde 2,1-aminomutase
MATVVSQLIEEYQRRTTRSRALAEEAQSAFPGGIVHDARYFRPYPIYIERAEGSRKWDVDGNEYVDYVGGHGALLLGHAHPAMEKAVREQAGRGTHYGACHELELRWAQLVQRLIPSAELVRFTGSGTEATMLAFRLARAFTGKSRIVRFNTHFHGWQDHAAFGVASHHDGTPSPGVLQELSDNITLCPPGDIEVMSRLLSENEDVAAVILEPTGATWGQIPLAPAFLHQLRELTQQHGVLLLFDEVVTGFRVAPGGAQAEFGITPDLTMLAKVLAGGLPGGAIVGRRDIMELLDLDACQEQGREKISHHGTYNANPLSAAAGIATLQIVAETDACQRASGYAARLRTELQQVISSAGLDWRVYGSFSGFHIYTNPDHEAVSSEDLDSGHFDYRKIKAASRSPVVGKLRIGLLVHGIDIFAWPGGSPSAVHTDADLEQTVDAFERTIRAMKGEGAFS